MQEHFFDLNTSDGEMPMFVSHPDEGTHPVVIFQMDAPGMRDELRDMCRRIAATGYYVMAGQLYYRQVREYSVYEDLDRDRMFGYMSSLTVPRVVDDCRAQIAHAAADPAADATKVGTVGYCMSGPFVLGLAAAEPTIVKAAASIHGVWLATDKPDSPHLGLPDMDAEVYIGAAEFDDYCPLDTLEIFETAMTAAGRPGRVEIHRGTHHGFAFPDREGIYDRDASERHWERMHSLFDRNLRQVTS